MPSNQTVPDPLGNPAPFAEPAWYNALASPYYHNSHRRLQRAVCKYLEDNILPNVEEWEENGEVPLEDRRRYVQAGFAFQEMPAEYADSVGLPGGASVEEWDVFHFFVLNYEIARIRSGGVVGGLAGGSAIGIPPVIHFGTQEDASFCLGGSDLASLKTTARKTSDGKSYITHDNCSSGVSVLVIPLDLPGISRRKIKNSGFNAGESTWVTHDNVVVPAENLIGDENRGLPCLMTNFNRERLIISVVTNAQARACLEDAWAYSLDRQTFGEPLFSHQIIRHKLATLARYIESHWAWIEQIAYHAKATGSVGPELASRMALAKVHGGRLLELANREAQQIFGGAGYQRGGVGSRVEQISRDLRVHVIGGGSEEIVTDLAVRQGMGQCRKRGAKL
ncbi:acyl-CoA dehydrogenase domain-containing protein [Thelonectria olida]|uniref:Acyl-CoA dehydrogenase domain-containing protein n=1 Tax=Thelonectria olida TaxID=1576542 RepID=A0A9P8W581_9HYPO|nr:acyl-CoA dehydrogenase domain-containing protein [Thelonectria olida]